MGSTTNPARESGDEHPEEDWQRVDQELRKRLEGWFARFRGVDAEELDRLVVVVAAGEISVVRDLVNGTRSAPVESTPPRG